MSPVSWLCPRCGRRVPNRAPACHCGTTQEQARAEQARPVATPAAAAPRRRRGPGFREIWKDLTWDLKALAIGVVVVGLAGLAWAVVPHRERPIAPVLGIVAPAPSPSPSPAAKGRWWWPFKK